MIFDLDVTYLVAVEIVTHYLWFLLTVSAVMSLLSTLEEYQCMTSSFVGLPTLATPRTSLSSTTRFIGLEYLGSRWVNSSWWQSSSSLLLIDVEYFVRTLASGSSNKHQCKTSFYILDPPHENNWITDTIKLKRFGVIKRSIRHIFLCRWSCNNDNNRCIDLY